MGLGVMGPESGSVPARAETDRAVREQLEFSRIMGLAWLVSKRVELELVFCTPTNKGAKL